MRDRIKQLAIKVEATEGVAVSLAAADVVAEYEDLAGTWTDEKNQRRPMRATLTKRHSVAGRTMGDITGRLELVPGDTVATDAPPCARLLQALGHQEMTLKTATMATTYAAQLTPGERLTGSAAADVFFVTGSGTTITYAVAGGDIAVAETLTGETSGGTWITHAAAPAATDAGFAYRPLSTTEPPSFTVAVNEDGKRKLYFGARGTGQITIGGSGEIGYLEFTLSGTSTTPSDVAAFSAGVSLPTKKPPTFKGATVDAHGDVLCVDALGFDFNNTVGMRRCASSSTGIKSYRITDREPNFTLDPEAELEATIDFFGKYAGDTVFGAQAAWGSGAGNRVWLLAPAAQYQALNQSEREGLIIYNVEMQPGEQGNLGGGLTGDGEYILAFG